MARLFLKKTGPEQIPEQLRNNITCCLFTYKSGKKVNQLHLRSPTDSQISDQGAALGTPTASSSGFKSSAKDATSSLKAFAVPRFRPKKRQR
jgi:hypothetical protein